MTWRASATLPLMLEVLSALGARRALAAERCSSMVVEADPNLRAHWPDLQAALRERFDARDDIDACARVRLSMNDAAIEVAVSLPDGRSASRSVSRRDDVEPTLEALLLLPQPRQAVIQQQPSEPSAPKAEPAHDLPVPAPAPAPKVVKRLALPKPGPQTQAGVLAGDRDAAASEAAESGGVLIELSLATGARLGDGQGSIGLGAIALLDIDGWLAGFEGRADRYQGITSGEGGPALELAALGGRRIRFGTLALDFVAGPALALQGATRVSQVSEGMNSEIRPAPPVTESHGVAPRLVVGSRLSFSARSVVRTFVAVDGVLGLTSPADLAGDVGNLPRWTLGLALGATVGTR
jgi:hypothetical protein